VAIHIAYVGPTVIGKDDIPFFADTRRFHLIINISMQEIVSKEVRIGGANYNIFLTVFDALATKNDLNCFNYLK
jgi:hypothetical protein